MLNAATRAARPSTPRSGLLHLLATTLSLLLACFAHSAQARPYARFMVPDSLLGAALHAADFEGAWNALLVAEARSSVAAPRSPLADSAAVFRRLERRVAEAETRELGTRIAAAALALRAHWNAPALRARIGAAEAESLAFVAQRAVQFGEAERLFRMALAHYRSLGERRRTAWVLGSMGVATFQNGDLARADSIYREALIARRALGDERMIGNTLNALGTVKLQTRQYLDAYGYFQQAAEVRERTGERAALGATLGYLGSTCVELGRSDSARVCFEKALELTVAAGDSVRTCDALINYARLLGQAGEFERAYRLDDRALAIAEQRGDLRYQRGAHQIAGLALRREGRFTEAAQRFEIAASFAEQLADTRSLAEILLSLGQVWNNLEDPVRARGPLERTLALADSLADEALGIQALNNLCISSLIAGDTTRALRLSSSALARAVAAGDSSLVHDASISLGQLAWEHGDARVAGLWFSRALDADRHLSPEKHAVDLADLASTLIATSRFDEATQQYTEAMRVATDAGALEKVWPALLGLGDVAERQGDMPRALMYDRRAATLIDTLRTRQTEERGSITLFSRRLFAYDALIHLLGKLAPQNPDSGYASEAFDWAERARARAMLDRLGGSARSAAPAPAHSLDEVRRMLESDQEAFLEYSASDSSTTLWVIMRSGVTRYTLPPVAALRTRVQMLRGGLSEPLGMDRAATRRAARALYSMLVEPAAARLSHVRRLIIAPDGPLTVLPFEALLARDVPDRDPVPRTAWLLERFDITYTPSASVWASGTPRPQAASGAIVALGDPRFGTIPGGASLPALTHTGEELDALASLARGRTWVPLRSADATRDRLMATPELANAEYIHLATHGEVNTSEPARSGLWLAAGSDSTSQFLSVADILALRLDARMVTLSACRTGLGRLERGEGMLGLSRAFLLAGARSVLVSLWDVNDRSTALLMRRFYEPLLSRGASPDVALAAAKHALLGAEETRDPFYWAPFVLIAEHPALR